MKNLSASSAKIFLAPTTVVLCAALLATPLVNAAQSNVLVLSQNPAALVSAVSIANSNASKKSAPSQASNRLSAPDEEHDSVSNTNTTRPNESTESGLAQLPFNTTVM
ncbi:MAG TPA: hypothetical protein VK032_03315, partial [Burkholderiaceae bacterium]|nr:hypothetical protein [Burkholderiaceae bacterium]